MRISGVEYKDNNNIVKNKRLSKDKVEGFSTALDNSFLDRSKKDLKNLLESIKRKGSQIVSTKEHSDVVEYKKLVKEYLNKVIDDTYELDKFSDTFNSRYYLTVKTVDKKLQELTNKILGEEMDNLSILTTIDEIQGLIVDIYR